MPLVGSSLVAADHTKGKAQCEQVEQKRSKKATTAVSIAPAPNAPASVCALKNRQEHPATARGTCLPTQRSPNVHRDKKNELAINPLAATVALQHVRCFGTEDRPGEFVPASPDVYEFIVYSGKDIKDLSVLQPQAAAAQPPQDPAILSAQAPPQFNQPQPPVEVEIQPEQPDQQQQQQQPSHPRQQRGGRSRSHARAPAACALKFESKLRFQPNGLYSE
jgi:hypothetical protein